MSAEGDRLVAYNLRVMGLFVAAFGLLGGSVVNWLADALPATRRPTRPRCAHCGAPRQRRAWSGVVEAFFAAGRCAYCGGKRGSRAWIIELTGLAFAVFLYRRDGDPVVFIPGLLVGLLFLLIAVIDLEHRLILQVVVFPSAALVVLASFFQPARGPAKTLSGGLAGLIILWAMYLLGIAFSRWIARRRGSPLDEVAFGFGDVMLGGLIGLIVGWPGVIIAVITGVLVAGVFSIAYVGWMLLRGKYSAFAPIPYGPFLLVGAALVYYGGRTALEGLIGGG
jgi:leader peptidase (prepilin peptidase)/N-methyltransferase